MSPEPFRAKLFLQVFTEGKHVGFLLLKGRCGDPMLDQVDLPNEFLAVDSVPVRRRPDGVLELAMAEAA